MNCSRDIGLPSLAANNLIEKSNLQKFKPTPKEYTQIYERIYFIHTLK